MPLGLLLWRVDKSFFLEMLHRWLTWCCSCSAQSLVQGSHPTKNTLFCLIRLDLTEPVSGGDGASVLLAVATRWRVRKPCMAQLRANVLPNPSEKCLYVEHWFVLVLNPLCVCPANIPPCS